MSSLVRICWLQPERDNGKEEIINRSRIKPSKFSVGDEVKVTYKSQKYKARILELNAKKDAAKRIHDTDDGFSSDDELPLKKVCPPRVPSPVVCSELSHQPTVPVAPGTTPVSEDQIKLTEPLRPSSPSRDRVTDELPLSSPRSPTPPPGFSAAVTTEQSQPTPTLPPASCHMPNAQPIILSTSLPVYETTPLLKQSRPTLNVTPAMPAAPAIRPSPSPPLYEATPSLASGPSQRSLNFNETPDSFLELLNYEPPSTLSQVLENQNKIFSAIGELKEQVETVEKTMARLAEVLTKIHAKPAPKPAKATSAIYVDNMDGSVQVGDENGKIVLKKQHVDAAFSLSMTGKDYVLKLMSMVFTPEELAASNYPGGRTVCGSEIKIKTSLSDHWKFKALLASAECNFPGCTEGRMLKVLKDAVNNKCRKLDSKLRK